MERKILPIEAQLLLSPEDPAPYTLIEADGEGAPAWPALLVCDHATNRMPAALDNLGVSANDLETHLALDIGAGNVTRFLSEALTLPAVLNGYSRLVVDCNRRLDDPSAFTLGDGVTTVTGNRDLSQADRQSRADAIYWPYHHAIRDRLTALEPLGTAPALVAIHSFTPVLNGSEREWHFGVLWDSDPRIPQLLIESLRSIPGIIVGDNEPYSGRDPHDFTIDHHGEAEGLPHVSIEIRQDLIETPEGVRHWGGLLAAALAPILDNADLYTFWTA
jgi:predicted N-formylglutamate amidohydrolase